MALRFLYWFLAYSRYNLSEMFFSDNPEKVKDASNLFRYKYELFLFHAIKVNPDSITYTFN